MSLVIFEVNEIPFSVLKKYTIENPNSNIAKLSHRILTKAEDLPENELYPSQTWASINTGESFLKHRAKWFADYVSSDSLYWNKLQKAGKRVSIIGSLHSSPATGFLEKGHNFVCFIPDFFSSDSKTFPSKYKAFQKFNIQVTDENKRFSSFSLLLKAAKSFIQNPIPENWGLNNFLAIKQIAKILFSSIFINKERLRLAQFTLSCSIFFNSLKAKPDLGIIFTNHVASMMHRYLHAYLQPVSNPYDDEWTEKYKHEVSFSIDLLDDWVGMISNLKDKNDLRIMILSSMGQKTNEKIDKEHIKEFTHDFILRQPEKLLEKLVPELPKFIQLGVMVPQYAFRFDSQETARHVHEKICEYGTSRNKRFGHYTNNSNFKSSIDGIYINTDLNKDVVTLSVQLNQDHVKLTNKTYSFKELGFEKKETDNHHSGEHDKNGILWSNFSLSNEKEINYLNFSKLLMEYFEKK